MTDVVPVELNYDEFRLRLSQAIRNAGSQKHFAAAAGLSRPYVNDVLHGRREPAARILAALDLRRVERFVFMGRQS